MEEGRDGGEVGSGGRDLLSAPGRDEGNQQEGRVATISPHLCITIRGA